MRLLAIDTATEVCGIGLWMDGDMRAELSLAHGQTHARHLMAGIQAVLELAGVALTDVEALAVTHGPGSFTGLRIGLSTVKGLAMAMNRPAVGISSLEALAFQAEGTEDLICPMIDARRKEVYWSLYRRTAQGLEPMEPEQVGPAVGAATRIKAPCQFIGSGARVYRNLLEGTLAVPGRWSPDDHSAIRVSAVARLAVQRLEGDTAYDINALRPAYLRRSDAELNARRNRSKAAQGQ